MVLEIFYKSYEAGRRNRNLLINPTINNPTIEFNITHSQHKKIMEILGIKTNQNKKLINYYAIKVNGGIKNGMSYERSDKIDTTV